MATPGEDPLESDALFNRFCDYLHVECNLALNTRLAYAADVRALLDYCKTEKFDPLAFTNNHLNNYVLHKRIQGLSPATIYRLLESIRAFYKYLRLDGVVTISPMENRGFYKTPKRLPRYLSLQEIDKLLHYKHDGSRASIRFKTMLELMYAGGLRLSEVLNLGRYAVDPDARSVKVMGKGSKERIVPIHARAVAALRAYLEYERPDGPFLFPNNRGVPFTRTMFWAALRRWCVKAGVPPVNPHVIRHSVATHLMRGGMGLRPLQEFLGHTSVTSTQIYSHVDTRDIKEMHKRYHPRP